MALGGRDRDATTRSLLDAARDELLAAGQGGFAMDGAARRAFYSIGAVYSRWADRGNLFADVGSDLIIPALTDGLDGTRSSRDAISWVLDDAHDHVLLAGELVLAGHSMAEVRPVSLQAWQTLRDGLAVHLSGGMAWYVATYALGNALLRAIGTRGPTPDTGRVTWFLDASDAASRTHPSAAVGASLEKFDIPVVPAPDRTDDVAIALIGAARLLLEEQGAAGTSTRGIAATAGVTTGALYRRYPGKSGLLADVLLTQLAPDRYTWTWDLVRALASADPFMMAADVLAQRLITMAEDAPAQKVLLQVGIAARSDPALRDQIDERIRIAHSARVDMARQFVEAGVLRRDVAPEVFAWGFQAIPVGVRATLPLGIPLDPDVVSPSMAALLAAAAAG